MKISRILLLVFLAGFYVLALALYNRMPDPMASHWNSQGAADGYASRFWGMFLLPFITTGLTLLLMALPGIDLLKRNVSRFRPAYDWTITVLAGFMLYLYILTLLWNADIRFSFMQLIVPAAAALFFFIGMMMEKARRNYLMGIRTPWTLNSEEVWNRTHKMGGLAFKIAALAALPGVFWPGLAMWFLLVPIMLAVTASVVASYVIYRRVKTAGG